MKQLVLTITLTGDSVEDECITPEKTAKYVDDFVWNLSEMLYESVRAKTYNIVELCDDCQELPAKHMIENEYLCDSCYTTYLTASLANALANVGTSDYE